MADKMTPPGKERHKQLTRDTGKALSHVCRGFIDLAHCLLNSGYEYVIFGWFTTDPLEKTFGKLRQGSGGTYFITVQSVIEKIRIQHAKLCLQIGVDIDGSADHHCDFCKRPLTELEVSVFDSLPELENNVTRETMLSIVYMAGCIEKKHKCDTPDTHLYFETYSSYFDALNRGQLTVAGDNIVQWSVFCFILFTQLSRDICRSFLINQFHDVAIKYGFSVTTAQCRVLANILMNNYSLLNTPASSKEAQLKELKLS